MTLPNSLTSIELCAFMGCRALQNISLPARLETIENGAFANCTALKSVTVPASVTRIGDSAFFGTGPVFLDLSQYDGVIADEPNVFLTRIFSKQVPDSNMRWIASSSTGCTVKCRNGCWRLTNAENSTWERCR
ncbi:MAG: leucine-rich repeat domain-containing protein [Holosporales bacterium]|nr:leucine-rich repeat domain-containing protein [Holosporales bacterium]